MALETLKDVKQINGFEVTRGVSNFGAERPVFIHDETNQIAFQIQNGPVKEVGVNGCQIDTLICAARLMLEGFNEKFPCTENQLAIQCLHGAAANLLKRRMDREKRQVEGLSKA